MKKTFILSAAILSIGIFISCEGSKTSYMCDCHLYGAGTNGERVNYTEVGKKNRESDCAEIEEQMKIKYDNPQFDVTASCKVVEEGN